MSIYTFDSTTHPNSSGDIFFIHGSWRIDMLTPRTLFLVTWIISYTTPMVFIHPRDPHPPDPSRHSRSHWRNLLQNHLKYPLKACQGTVIMWSSYCCCCCCCCWSCCRCGGCCGICCDQQMECDTEIPVDDRGELRVPAGKISNSAYHSSFVLHLFLKEINIDKPCQSCFVLFKWKEMETTCGTLNVCCAPESSMISSTSWWRLTVAIAAAMPAGESWSPGNSVGYPWTDTPNMILNPGKIKDTDS